jgi:hypothetical protein
MNQTWPHCVNQMGKTHSKPLAARLGRGTAWARNAMCESALTHSLYNFRVSAPMTFQCTDYYQLYYQLSVCSSADVCKVQILCTVTDQLDHGVASGLARWETWRLWATSFNLGKLALCNFHNRWHECSHLRHGKQQTNHRRVLIDIIALNVFLTDILY